MTTAALRKALYAGLALLIVVAVARYYTTPPPLYTETRFMMGTFVTLTIAGVDEPQASADADRAYARMGEIERQMTRVEATELWTINENGGGQVGGQTADVLRSALNWAQLSDGAFDPTLAELIDLWDIPAGAKPPPSAREIRRALSRTGWQRARWLGSMHTVQLDRVSLDVGGIAKGYAVDQAALALHRAGADNFIVNAGGDLKVSGTKNGKPWRVGIQDPDNLQALLHILEPTSGALVTSGDYERAYEWDGQRIHHIFDPATGRPADQCRSVTVWSHSAMDGDAAATAAFVMGPERGLEWLEQLPGLEGLIVDVQGKQHQTSGFFTVAPIGAPGPAGSTQQPPSGQPPKQDSAK